MDELEPLAACQRLVVLAGELVDREGIVPPLFTQVAVRGERQEPRQVDGALGHGDRLTRYAREERPPVRSVAWHTLRGRSCRARHAGRAVIRPSVDVLEVREEERVDRLAGHGRSPRRQRSAVQRTPPPMASEVIALGRASAPSLSRSASAASGPAQPSAPRRFR